MLALVCFLVVAATLHTLAQTTPCVPATIGLSPGIWNTSAGTYLGSAIGQTFLATDTLLIRVTVWRPPNDIDAVGTTLFITEVDSSFSPARPNTGAKLRMGPTVFVRDSDPSGQLIRMDFVLDPPLVLPSAGLYAFFLQREGCDGGVTNIVATQPGAYPGGIFWHSPRTSGGPCYLRPVSGWADADLIFEIEFCRDALTPVVRESWGRLKVTYR